MVLGLNHRVAALLRQRPVAGALGLRVYLLQAEQGSFEFLEVLLADSGKRLVDRNRGLGQQAAQIALRDRRQPGNDLSPLALSYATEIFVLEIGGQLCLLRLVPGGWHGEIARFA